MTKTHTKPLLLVITLGLLGTAMTACGGGGNGAPAIRVTVTAPAEVTTDAPRAATVTAPATAPADATQQTIDRWTSNGPGGVTVALARAGEPVELYTSGVATPSGDAVAT